MKKFLAIILTFALCFGVLSVALAAEDEATVPDGYIGIYTAEDLDNIRNNLSGKYILMNNIDLSSYENWTPIGSSETPFTGELDGNGYVIKNMKIHKECTDGEEPCFGLFSSLQAADITGLMLLNVDVNIKFIGETPESFGIGSLSGYAGGVTLKNCITSGNITVDGFNEGSLGGIIGTGGSLSELTNCINKTNINLSSQNISDICIGGFLSKNTMSRIIQSCNYGDITVSGTDSDLRSREIKIGGLISDFGNYHSEIYDSYNRGNISIDFSSPSAYVGGITGYGFLIDRCYNAGNISVPESFSGFVGGISGLYLESAFAVIPPSYIENSYYNNENLYPSYVEEGIPPREGYFTSVEYITSEEMKKQESFVGFDFDNVWKMEENGYPVLRNTPVIPETEKPGVTKPTITTEPTTEETTSSYAEETTTMSVATPVEPSTTEPATEENTTQPVATPIEPSITQPIMATTEPVTEPTTAEIVSTVKTTEPVTNPVTEPSTAVAVTTQLATVTTQPVTESTTYPVTEIEPTTITVTEPSTAPSVTETEPSTSTTVPTTEPFATPDEPTTEPTTEPDKCRVLAWLIKTINIIIDWFKEVLIALGWYCEIMI